jgi:hypothetical protein
MKNTIKFLGLVFVFTFFANILAANTLTAFPNCKNEISGPDNLYSFSQKHGGTTGTNYFMARNDIKGGSDPTKIRRLKKISIKHHCRVEKIQVTLVNNAGKKAIIEAGGTEGKWSHIYLDNDEYIIRVTGRSGTLIDQITFYTNKRRKLGPYGGNGGTPFSIQVPRNSRVVGFRGKYGNAINQIGLVYITKNSSNSSKPSTGTAKKMPTNLKFHIVSKINNLNLDVRGGSKKSGAQIWMYKPNTSSAQHWTFVSAGAGYYRIKSAISGLYLQVDGGGRKSGAAIVQHSKNRSSAQLWKAISAGGDYFYLQSKASGLYLDVRGGGMSSKTPVWQHPLNKTNAQKWRLQKIKATKKKKKKSDDYEFDMDKAGG